MTDHLNSKLSSHDLLYNIMTGMAIVLSVVCLSLTVAIFLFPGTPLNPFPPTRRTATPSSITLLPSSTAEGTSSLDLRVLSSDTPASMDANTPTLTRTPPHGETPSPTFSPTSLTLTQGFPFLLGKGGIRTSVAFQGCAWQGVAGQVFDPLGVPIPNLFVHIDGSLNGRPLSQDATTATLPVYGEGAYAFTLGETPLPSENTIWIQLLDNTRRALSDRVYIKTFEGCDRNLVLVDFQQVTP
jgi:hypothetical protein